jgi:hypothetical protein
MKIKWDNMYSKDSNIKFSHNKESEKDIIKPI